MWVWLDRNQCSANRRFSWGTALSLSSDILHFVLSAGCETSCSLFHKFSLSNAKDAPTQHDAIQPQEGFTPSGVLAVVRNTVYQLVWFRTMQVFPLPRLELAYVLIKDRITVHIQKTLGVKPFNNCVRILNIHIFVASTLNVILCYFISRPLCLKVSECFQITSKVVHCCLLCLSSFCLTYLLCLPVADSTVVNAKANNF